MTITRKEPETSKEAKRMALAILDVLVGSRTPLQAAECLGVSLPRYYQLESRALDGLLAACEPRPRGRQTSAESELATARKDVDRLKRELTRYQSLVRLTQRTVGVPPPTPAKNAKRKRKPNVRGLRRAEQLRDEVASGAPVPSRRGTGEASRTGTEPPGVGGTV